MTMCWRQTSQELQEKKKGIIYLKKLNIDNIN